MMPDWEEIYQINMSLNKTNQPQFNTCEYNIVYDLAIEKRITKLVQMRKYRDDEDPDVNELYYREVQAVANKIMHEVDIMTCNGLRSRVRKHDLEDVLYEWNLTDFEVESVIDLIDKDIYFVPEEIYIAGEIPLKHPYGTMVIMPEEHTLQIVTDIPDTVQLSSFSVQNTVKKSRKTKWKRLELEDKPSQTTSAEPTIQPIKKSGELILRLPKQTRKQQADARWQWANAMDKIKNFNLYKFENYLQESERLSHCYGRLRYIASLPDYDAYDFSEEDQLTCGQFATRMYNRLKCGPIKYGKWRFYELHVRGFLENKYPLLRVEQYDTIIDVFASHCVGSIEWSPDMVKKEKESCKPNVPPPEKRSYTELYLDSGLNMEALTDLCLIPEIKEMQDAACEELYIQVKRHNREIGHFHSHFCKCQHPRGYENILSNMRRVKDGIYSPILKDVLPSNMSVQECIQRHLDSHQSVPTNSSNPLVSSMASLLMDHLVKSITSSWQGITIMSGVLASIVGTLISIIFSIIDIIKNGSNGLRITSLICSFVALLGQAAVAVGAGCLFTEYPNITDVLTSLFGNVDESMTVGELIDSLQHQKTIPIIEQCLMQQAEVVQCIPRKLSTVTPYETERPTYAQQVSSNTLKMAQKRTPITLSDQKNISQGVAERQPASGTGYPVESLVYTCDSVIMATNVYVPEGLVPRNTPGNGLCGFQAIVDGLGIKETADELRQFLAKRSEFSFHADELKVKVDRNGHLNREGWFNSDMFMPLCRVFGCTFVLVDENGNNVEYQPCVKPRKTIYIQCKNQHFSLLERPQKQGMPSIETFLSLGCGLIGLSLGIASCCGLNGVTKFNNEYIKNHRLKTALKADVTEAKELLETISEDVFGYHMSSHSKLKEKILLLTDKLAKYLAQPNTYYAANPKEYFKYREAMMEAEKLLTSCGTINSKMPNYLSQALSLLSSDLARVKVTFQELGRAVLSGRVRQEPVPIMVVGRYGVGKTYFIRQYLIKALQKEFGWSDDVYSLQFSGQVYFKPYAGQEVCFYDEFLGKKEEDPLIEHINGICSIDQYNMPGADLWTKVQECLFNTIFLVSNRHHCSLLNKLTKEAEEALYSRMNRIEIINKSAPPTNDYTREQLTHTDDYGEFEIRWYLKPPTNSSPAVAKSATKTGTNTRALDDPYVIITKEELVQIIAQKIRIKHAEHHKLPKPAESGILVPQKPLVIPPKQNMGQHPDVPIDSVLKHNRLVDAATKSEVIPEEIPEDPVIISAEERKVIIAELTKLAMTGVTTTDFIEAVDEAVDGGVMLNQNINELKTLVDVVIRFNPEYESAPLVQDLKKISTPPPVQQGSTDAKVDHMVVLLSGQTDTGKSVLATDLSYKLHTLLKLPIINVTTQALSNISASQPSIVVLHDKMDNEQAYIQFYDSLPKPSIIINTNNLRFSSAWSIVALESEVDYTSSLYNKLLVKGANFLAGLKRAVTILPHSSATPEPGFARRIGVHGYIKHAGCQHFRGEDVTEWYNVKRYGRLVTPDGSKEVNQPDLLKNILNKYTALLARVGGVIFEEGEVLHNTADVELRFESIEQAKDYVNNPSKILMLYNKFITGKNTGSTPEIAISQRVVWSTFVFNASMFAINDFEDLESVKVMAKNSYTLLMKANSEFTCCMNMRDFKAYCANQKIVYEVKGTLKGMLAIYSHEFVESDVRSLVLTEHKENETVSYSYDCGDIANLLINGIQHTTGIKLQHAIYLNDYKENILSHPYMIGPKLKYEPKRILLKQVTEEAPMFMKIWDTFTKSKWFKVLKVVIGIMVAIAGIYTLLSLAHIIYKWCKGSSPIIQVGDVKSVYLQVDGGVCKCDMQAANSYVDVIIQTDLKNIPDMTDLIPEAIEEVYGEEYSLGSIRYVHEQSDVKSEKNPKKKGKALSKKPLQVISNAISGQQAHVSDNQLSIMSKVYDAGCWVVGSRSACYGLRWKGLDVLTPAHIWKQSGDKGTANIAQFIDGHEQVITVQCMVYFLDHNNDVAFVRLQDSSGRGGRNTISMAADLTKYFVKEKNIDAVQSAAMLSRAIQSQLRPYAFKSAKPLIMAGYAQVNQLKASTDYDKESRQLIFLRSSLQDILSKPGDCGSPYVCLDNFVDHNCILGLHSSLMPCGKQSLGSVITQEYLEAVVTMATIGAEQQGVVMAGEIDLVKVDVKGMKLLPPETEVYAKGHGFTPMYVEWYDSLEEVVQEEKEIWYDAESFPEANVCVVGYDKKHKPPHKGKPSHIPTPWSAELEQQLPKTKFLAVTDYKQHSDPSSLMTLKGRPSILATQLHKYNDPVPKGATFNTLLEIGKDCLYSDCKTKYSGGLRILTDLEVINGTYINPRDTLYGGLEPMDLETSAGDYPARKWGITTKRPLFKKMVQRTASGRDLYTWDNTVRATDVRYSTYNVEYWAAQGIRVLLPMKDCLKYEIVDKQDKSRLFTSLSIEEIFLGRKYTGALQARVMQEHLHSHTQIGINAFPGFHALYDRFMKTSLYGEAGDFSRWDKHLAKEVLHAAMMVCAKLYIEENPEITDSIQNIYNVMADSLLNSMSIADGFVYFKNRGMPSGCPVTAMINSFANDIMMYMCLYYLVEQHNSDVDTLSDLEYIAKYFPSDSPYNGCSPQKQPKIQFTMQWVKEHFDWITYGDDFMSVISTKFLWLVNFKTRKQFYKQVVGMDYDSPNKDGTEVYYQPLEELSFISRTFRREAGITFAALKKPSIESLLHWTRIAGKHQYESNLQDCLWESIAWGQEYYEKICNIIHWIMLWSRNRGMELDVAISPWSIALQDMISKITISVAPPLPEVAKGDIERRQCNPENGLSLQIEENDKFEERLSKLIIETHTKGRMAQGSSENFTLLKQVSEVVEKVDLSSCKEIIKQNNFPAAITDAGGVTVNICFTGKTYKKFAVVQSDLQKVLAQPLEKLCTFKRVTLCERSLDGGKSIAPIWQVQYTPVSGGITSAMSGLKLEDKHQKQRKAQATGTQERAPMQDGKDQHTDGALPIDVYATKGVPKGQINSAIWESDLCEIKGKYMETPDSPISIAIDTPAHTVIFTRALNDSTNMPPAMRIWASNHASTNASRMIKLKLVSAATLINEIVVGIAAQKKTTYTIQELQLIEWDAVNPQDVAAEIELKLANVDWGRGAAADSASSVFNANRYRLRDYAATEGTDAAPVDIPTLVIMTRVGIQNSYANPDVSIQIAVQEKFQGGKFLMDAQKLNAGLPAASVLGLAANNMESLSSWLNVEKGKPFNITCDGTMLTDEVSLQSEDDEAAITRRAECSLQGYWAATNNTPATPELRANAFVPMSAKGFCLPLYNRDTEEVVIRDSDGATRTYTLNGWSNPALHQQSAVPDTQGFFDNMAFNRATRNGTGSIVAQTTVYQTPVAPRYVLLAHSLNGAAVFPASENVNTDQSTFGIDMNKLVRNIDQAAYEQTLLDLLDDISAYEDKVVTVLPASTISYDVQHSRQFMQRDDASINMQGPYQVATHNDTVRQVTPLASVLVEYFNTELNQVVRCLYSLLNGMYAIRESGTAISVTPCRFDGTQRIYARDAADTNVIAPAFGLTMSASFTLSTNLQLLVGLVNEVKRNLTHSLDPNFSRVAFPLTTPKTLPTTLAETQAPVEYDDVGFVQALNRKLQTVGVTPTSAQLVLFNLNTIVGGTVTMIVAYDPMYKAFFISNNPQSAADSYRAFRKITYEDVGISQIRVINKISGSIPLTNTSNWINRVVDSSSEARIFTGRNLIQRNAIGPNGQVRTYFRKSRLAQAEEMALAAAGGFASQIFSSIFSYLAKKNLMDQQIQNDLLKLKAQFENAEKLQDQKFQQQLELQGLKAQSIKNTYPTSFAPTTTIQEPNNDYGLTFDSSGKVIQPQPSTSQAGSGNNQDVAVPSTPLSIAGNAPVASTSYDNGAKSINWTTLTGYQDKPNITWYKPINTEQRLSQNGTIHIGKSTSEHPWNGTTMKFVKSH